MSTHHHTRRTTIARRWAVAASAAAVALASASPALADPGAPGSTFPEQPGTNLQSGCHAILSNPNNAYSNRAEPAFLITTGLTVDACTPGV